MGKLFNRLVDEGLYKDWASLLDWLFDDNRFQNWSSGYVGALTKKIKRLPQIGNNTYFYDCAKNLIFPSERTDHNMLDSERQARWYRPGNRAALREGRHMWWQG